MTTLQLITDRGTTVVYNFDHVVRLAVDNERVIVSLSSGEPEVWDLNAASRAAILAWIAEINNT